MSLEDESTGDSKPKSNLRGVNEALNALNGTQTGTHCFMVYPDLTSLRAIYSRYTKIQLEDNNEIVIMLPYYETTDMVRLVLSGADANDDNVNRNLGRFSGINVEKFEREGFLIIRDSLKANVDSNQEQQGNEYDAYASGTEKNMNLAAFLNVLNRLATRRHKNGITMLLDMGLFQHGVYDHRMQRIEKFEASIPKEYGNINLKVFCLYHQRDFERRFSQEQQVTLLDYHSRSIMLVSAN